MFFFSQERDNIFELDFLAFSIENNMQISISIKSLSMLQLNIPKDLSKDISSRGQ